jgi:hypothetical protein
MKRAVGSGLAILLLVGCVPAPPRSATDNIQSSIGVAPVARGYPEHIGSTESSGEPSVPWPKFEAGPSGPANEAELAIIWRAHELREKHPGATPAQLAQMLVREPVWEQKAKFVPTARRTVVIREALVLW